MTTLTLEEQLVAARKTVAALMRRVEYKVATGASAVSALEQGVALERLVAERTTQLAAEHAALGEAMAELRRTQNELVQAQKLEAVGRLAAGIAHEINTPIQFVSDSVVFVQEAFQQLLSVFPLCAALREAAAQGAIDSQLVRALAEAEEAAGLDYLVTQVPRALERSLEGLARVATIVRAMKEFAHPDDREKSPADINAALASTIAIARNEYKYVAEVETDYGNLPNVACHVGELNQVFLNLIVNAAHAIGEARRDGTRGRIRIRTQLEGAVVHVSVADDGTGIPDEVRDRIFDPFFTTKPVGKGTGQGLFIARSVVVEKHCGTLTVESTVGAGTTFHVRIPVSPAATSARS
jgi:signal transduction histidine kinase